VKVVLVTGSREWTDREAVRTRLAHHDPGHRIDHETVLVHGAARGADSIAAEIAVEWGWTVLPMPAQWDRDGKRAGPVRNRRMVDVVARLGLCGWDVQVEGFPLGRSPGTRGCLTMAERVFGADAVHVTEGRP
jgi:hypothetical protein